MLSIFLHILVFLALVALSVARIRDFERNAQMLAAGRTFRFRQKRRARPPD